MTLPYHGVNCMPRPTAPAHNRHAPAHRTHQTADQTRKHTVTNTPYVPFVSLSCSFSSAPDFLPLSLLQHAATHFIT